MAVPAVVLLIPKYLVLVQLGIYNTYAGMIIPLLADAAGVFIMRQFFISIPVEVEESARLDGAGPFRTFWCVVLPMARPAVTPLGADFMVTAPKYVGAQSTEPALSQESAAE